MRVDLDRKFPFSENCYFDMVANTVVDMQDGKIVNNTIIYGNELIVLKMLIQAYPKAVAKERILAAINSGSDNSEVRRVISELKKRHSLLGTWIPRAKDGEYRLLDPLLPADKPGRKIIENPPIQNQTCVLKSTGICVRPNFVKEARQDIFAALDEAGLLNSAFLQQSVQ